MVFRGAVTDVTADGVAFYGDRNCGMHPTKMSPGPSD